MLKGLVVFIFSIFFTYILIRLAPKLGTIDLPNSRRLNKSPVPSAGGLAILLTWYSGLIYIHFFGHIDTNLFWALISGLLLAVVGFMDDIFGLKPGIRILAQIISTFSALYFLGGLTHLDLGFTIIKSKWILTAISFIGIIWCINLYNFMDGMDGYAGLEIVFMMFFLNLFTGASYNLLLLAATAGFLVWNWPPAKIYMGDTGSTVLGFTIGVLLVRYQNTDQLNLISGLIPFALFWFDATITLLRRVKRKENITEAHKKHAYERLIQSGLSHKRILLIGLVINSLLFALAYLAIEYKAYVLGFFLLAVILLFIYTKWADSRYPFDKEEV